MRTFGIRGKLILKFRPVIGDLTVNYKETSIFSEKRSATGF